MSVSYTVAAPCTAPRFVHDCNICRFIGGTDSGDWYICGGCDPENGSGEYIRRYGDDGPDYSAGNDMIIFVSRRFDEGIALYKNWINNGGRIAGDDDSWLREIAEADQDLRWAMKG